MKHYCRNCDLCINARSQLKAESKDNPHILFLFDCPNHSQNAKGEFFAGKNMTLFRDMVKHYGLFTYSAFNTIMKCRPKTNDLREFKDMELHLYNCSQYHFIPEFAGMASKLQLIVTFGKFAYKYISGNNVVYMNEWNELLFKYQEVGDFVILPLPALTTLINEDLLNDAIKSVYKHYADNINWSHKYYTVPREIIKGSKV